MTSPRNTNVVIPDDFRFVGSFEYRTGFVADLSNYDVYVSIEDSDHFAIVDAYGFHNKFNRNKPPSAWQGYHKEFGKKVYRILDSEADPSISPNSK